MKSKQHRVLLVGLSLAPICGCDAPAERPVDVRGEVESPVAVGDDPTDADADCNGCGSLAGEIDLWACPGAMEAYQAMTACFCGACPDSPLCAPTEEVPTNEEVQAFQACVSASEADGTCTAVVEACVSDKRAKTVVASSE